MIYKIKLQDSGVFVIYERFGWKYLHIWLPLDYFAVRCDSDGEMVEQTAQELVDKHIKMRKLKKHVSGKNYYVE